MELNIGMRISFDGIKGQIVGEDFECWHVLRADRVPGGGPNDTWLVLKDSKDISIELGLMKIANFTPYVGMQVNTNGTIGDVALQDWFTGEIVNIKPAYFDVYRDDLTLGEGVLHNGCKTWRISRNSPAEIIILYSLLCKKCGETGHAYCNVEGSQLCYECACELGFEQCVKCNTYLKGLKHGYCPECFEKMAFCDGCGNITDRTSMAQHKGKLLCKSCKSKLKDIKSKVASDEEISKIVKMLTSDIPKTMLRTNTYNWEDDGVSKIAAKIGKVQKPIYIYGLIDRPEYGIAISPDLWREDVINTPIGAINVIKTSNLKSIGICRNLRLNHPDWVAGFIKTFNNLTLSA